MKHFLFTVFSVCILTTIYMVEWFIHVFMHLHINQFFYFFFC